MKISDLPELTALPTDGFVPIVSNGTTYKISTSFFGGGGGSGTPSAKALSDEFNGSTLSDTWLWYNQKIAVASVSGGNLSLTKPPSGSGFNDLSSLYKAAPPAPPWSMTAKITVLGDNSTFTNQGLMIGSNTGKITTFNSGWGSSSRRIEIYNFNSFSQFSGAAQERQVSGVVGGKGTAYYARISVSATTVEFRASEDEASLLYPAGLIYSRGITSYLGSIDRAGFNMESRSGNASLLVDWVRFTATA